MSVNGSVWYDADAPHGGHEASGIGRRNGIRRFRPAHRGHVLSRTRPAGPRPGPGTGAPAPMWANGHRT